jgi:hypothetical protein
MTDLNQTRQAAYSKLTLAIQRYVALSSPPKWTATPLISDLPRASARVTRLYDANRPDEARDLQWYIEQELRRRSVRHEWTPARRGEAAWKSMARRLEHCLEYAEQVGAISGEYLRVVRDRLVDAQHWVRYFETQRRCDLRLN